MAREYLAIQGSATPSERAFSSGGITGTAKRNCLTPEAFEALQLLKSAYRNGHLAADKDAHKHSLSDMDTYSWLVEIVMYLDSTKIYGFGSSSLLAWTWTEPTEPEPMVRFKKISWTEPKVQFSVLKNLVRTWPTRTAASLLSGEVMSFNNLKLTY